MKKTDRFREVIADLPPNYVFTTGTLLGMSNLPGADRSCARLAIKEAVELKTVKKLEHRLGTRGKPNTYQRLQEND